MTPIGTIAAPHVHFFSGRQESFIESSGQWRRATPEDSARLHTGYDRATGEPSVGVYIAPKGNGLLCVGFDLWRIDSSLRPSAIERLEQQWRQREATTLSKSMLRHVQRRAHFSRSFARFEVSPERLGDWRGELEAILSEPNNYELA
jgi:hypothetical protein